MSDFSWCILTHQPADKVAKMLQYWESLVTGKVIILYGGKEEEYAKIEYELKGFVSDSRLVTRDHPRERQSYEEVFRVAAELVKNIPSKYLYFTEFDQIPLRSDFQNQLAISMNKSGADLLCNGLNRVDGTNHPHYLNHLYDGALSGEISALSVRENKEIILSCWGFGQCWNREAFLRVAAVRSCSRVYLELWIPSIAHHLGFSVQSLNIDPDWNTPQGDLRQEDVSSLDEPLLIAHPIKTFW